MFDEQANKHNYKNDVWIVVESEIKLTFWGVLAYPYPAQIINYGLEDKELFHGDKELFPGDKVRDWR